MRLDPTVAMLECSPGQSRTASARRLSEHVFQLGQKDIVRGGAAVAVGNVSPPVDNYSSAQSCHPQQPRHLLVTIGVPYHVAGPEKAGQCIL